MNGIYQYRDLQTNEIVYIGKDSQIDKDKRHKEHLMPSKYKDQPFNTILQNNVDRYQYEIIYCGNYSESMLNTLEINSIAEINPKFNFTKGGDGLIGFKHSEESKLKMSKTRKGKPLSKEHCKKISEAISGEKHPFYGKKHSEETRKKISEANKNKVMSIESRRKISENNSKYWKGKHLSDETKAKLTESHKKRYARIIKDGKYKGKQIYSIALDGKRIKHSIYSEKLINWFNMNYPNQKLIMESD